MAEPTFQPLLANPLFAARLGGLLLFGLLAFVVLLVVAACVLRFGSRPPPLRPHYERLGRVAPDAPCPCAENTGQPRAYRDCCRPRDVEKLTADVQEYIWKRWSRRSYAGRRRSRTMQTRLEEYPIPPLVLPSWVTHPGRYRFPIEEKRLRRWNPLRAQRRKAPRFEPESSPGDDLPF